MENFDKAHLTSHDFGVNGEDAEDVDSADAQPNIEIDELSPEGRKAFELTETAEDLFASVSDMMTDASVDVNDLPDLAGIKDELEMMIRRLREDEGLTSSEVMAKQNALETLTSEVTEISRRTALRNRLVA